MFWLQIRVDLFNYIFASIYRSVFRELIFGIPTQFDLLKKIMLTTILKKAVNNNNLKTNFFLNW